MKIPRLFTKETALRAAIGAVLLAVTPGAALAEVSIYDNNGWSIAFDGRTAGFYSYEFGDSTPHQANGQPSTGGLIWTGFTNQPDQDPAMCAMGGFANGKPCTFTTSRIHSGFVGNIFGFTARHKISENLTATGRIALWWPIETDQYRGFSSMSPDPRESYAKLEGPWGNVLFGRTLGLHDRGSTLVDYYYADGSSIGSPCNVTQQGPLCGHIGYGYQFPGYNAGIIYSTPLVSGFQLSAGIYDPVRIGLSGVLLSSLSYPRVESEATYTLKGDRLFVTLFANGMWQQAKGFVTDAAGANAPLTANAYGVSGGGRIEFAGFKLGAGTNFDVGGGDLSGLVGDVPIDRAGKLRHVKGYMVQAMYSMASWDFSAGAGETLVQETADDVTRGLSVIKTRLGANGTINYRLDSSVVLNAQYFRAQHVFWLGEKQALNFIHGGMTFTW